MSDFNSNLSKISHTDSLTHCMRSCLLRSRTVICKAVSESRLCLREISCVVREVLSGCKMLCLFQFICDYNLWTTGATKNLKHYNKSQFVPPELMSFSDFSNVTVTYYSAETVPNSQIQFEEHFAKSFPNEFVENRVPFLIQQFLYSKFLE